MAGTTGENKRICLFSLSESKLRQQLADILDSPAAALTYQDGEGVLSLSAQQEEITEAVTQRLGDSVYSTDGESLEQRVVQLLTQHGKTVATAESCTGGLVSARLTGVSGSSRVFGTGVVSYSPECKQKLLQVSPDTIQREGTVSVNTAGQMARGIRRSAAADIGVAVTGEAGPVPAENHPVGTVFVALADGKRTWVHRLQLEGDRQAIRRQAAAYVLYLLYRYLQAYPTVMAGGVSNRTAKRQIPRTQGEKNPRLLARLLPWRGDSARWIAAKCVAWLAVLVLLCGGGYLGYRYLLEPTMNRELQTSLGKVYRQDASDLTAVPDNGNYPAGMMAQFRGLYDMNPDVGGWIHIENTAVDYPVMTYSNKQYENHNFNKQYSVYGQPYYGANTDLRDGRVTVIYGRNTDDGQMFSDLLNYRRVAFLQEHSVIQLDTLYNSHQWQIFAVLVVDENNPKECDYDRTTFAGDREYAEYLDMLQERSLFNSDCRVTAQDDLLLLSVNAETVYGFSSARLVVAARRVTDAQAEASYWVNTQVRLPERLLQRTTRIPTYSTRPTTRPTTTQTTTAATTPPTQSGETTGTTLPTGQGSQTSRDEDATTPTQSEDGASSSSSGGSGSEQPSTSGSGDSTTLPSGESSTTTSKTDDKGTDDDHSGN